MRHGTKPLRRSSESYKRGFGLMGWERELSLPAATSPNHNLISTSTQKTPVAFIFDRKAASLVFRSRSAAPLRICHSDEIEAILDDEIISTADGGYQRYLVRWRGRPKLDCTWLRGEEIMQLNLDLIDDYHLHHSSEANCFKSRESWWGSLF